MNLLDRTKALIDMTSETLDAAQARSDAPGYLIPCPLGSVIGLPDIPDRLARPSLSVGRLTGTTFFSPCALACPLCGSMHGYFDSAQSAKAAWEAHLAAISWKSPQWDALTRMGELGFLPTAFAERLNQPKP